MKTFMLVEVTERYKLYAKTGGGHMGDNFALAWYVSFVGNISGTHYFVLNLDGSTLLNIKRRRIDIATNYLVQAGVL